MTTFTFSAIAGKVRNYQTGKKQWNTICVIINKSGGCIDCGKGCHRYLAKIKWGWDRLFASSLDQGLDNRPLISSDTQMRYARVR